MSFSSNASAAAGKVTLWPVDFTLNSYNYVAKRAQLWASMLVTVKRVVLGTGINLLLTIMIAYPLSKETNEFKYRSFYTWIFFITMLFGGGLIPWY